MASHADARKAVESVVKEVALLTEQIFDHSPIVRKEINAFIDNFEKNQRHKEFEGLLRASHSLVEASETASDQMLAEGRLSEVTEHVNRLADKIEALTTPKYQEEHEAYLKAIEDGQNHYLQVCKDEAMRKMRSAAGLDS